jgi:MATE family multidrug resistance protein
MSEGTYLLPGMQPRRVPLVERDEIDEDVISPSPIIRSSVRNLDSLRAPANFFEQLVSMPRRMSRLYHSKESPVLKTNEEYYFEKLGEAGIKDCERHRPSSSREVASDDEEELEDDHVFGLTLSSTALDTWKLLLTQAAPVSAGFLLDVFGDIVTLSYAGNYIIDDELRSSRFAGIALSNVLANVTGISVLYGMASALETLSSQSNGAKRYKEVGYLLQRALLILTLIALLCTPIWYYIGGLCKLQGIDPVICETAQTFLRIRICAMPSYVVHICLEFYLMSVGVFHPSMYGGIVINLTLILSNYIFLKIFKFDYEYLAYSIVLSSILGLAVQLSMCWTHPNVQRTLQPLSMAAFDDWCEFLYLGSSATVMLCSEWWAYEFLALFASLLGPDSLSAEVILIQTAYLAYIPPLCVGHAVTSLVGNSLGAGYRDLSKRIGRHALLAIVYIEIFVGILVYCCSPMWINFLIRDDKVRLIAQAAVPLLSYYAIIDTFSAIAGGILKGAGKQGLGAMLNLSCYYVIALPCAWVFSFMLGMGVNGLLLGFCVGTTCLLAAVLYLLLRHEDYIYSDAYHRLGVRNDSSL